MSSLLLGVSIISFAVAMWAIRASSLARTRRAPVEFGHGGEYSSVSTSGDVSRVRAEQLSIGQALRAAKRTADLSI